MKKLTCFLTILFCLGIPAAQAQLIVGNGYNAQQLGENLAGDNIVVTNSSITGDAQQYGIFSYSGNGLQTTSGVILSTGNIFDAVGSNSASGMGMDMSGSGDSELSALSGQPTFDAVVFSFDFEVQSDNIEFQYIFMSEEYNEYVGSTFNDVFAFYISGPGIIGKENLAVVPSTTAPVTINTINNQSYWQYFVNNDTPPYTANVEFDGFTTLMTAKKEGLTQCGIYTLELKIADAGDGVLDAAVLLQENSLIQANISATANTFSENDIALEGCIKASFTFQLDSAYAEDTFIPVGIGGNAINGIDYAQIDSSIVIPAGQTSATIIIDALADGLTEGQETIELYFKSAPCQPKDTVILYIDDYNLIEFTSTPTDMSCNGDDTGEVTFGITGGIPPYEVTLTDSATNEISVYTTMPVTALEASTYYVQIIDGYGCSAEDIVNASLFDAGETFLPDGNGESYTTSINLSGFAAGETLTDINQLVSICATMEHSFMGELDIVLEAPDGTQIELKGHPGGAVCNLGEPVASGPVDTHSEILTPGIGYTYCWTPNPDFETMASEAGNYTYTYITTTGDEQSDKYLPPGTYESDDPLTDLIGVPLNGDWTIIITDHNPNDNGYIFDWSISLSADLPDSIFTISQPDLPVITHTTIKPGCGGSNGEIDITVTGGATPYTYDWNTGATSEDLTGLGSGTYSVTVLGSDGCSYDFSFDLSNNGSVVLSGTTQDVSCQGADNGTVDLSVTGGTSPFTYSWSNSEITEDISSLPTGNYTITVNDAGGCSGIESFLIEQIPQMLANATITNEECGEAEGLIDLSVSGGTLPYTYLWSNSETTEDIDELFQGTYTVTVTDNNLCTITSEYNIINLVGSCLPDCDLEIISSIINNEICGNGQGAIDLTIFTSHTPYSVSWSNGASTDDLTGLSVGTYTISVSDAEGCELVQEFIIDNETGTLSINNAIILDDYCGNGQGGVNITVSGGAMPYGYIWSDASTSEDLSGVYNGDYFVTVSDANGCQIQTSATVNNNTGTLSQQYGNAMDETCGNGQGSVDITITGGALPYNYNWSNGFSSQDLININEGTYSCTITDNSNCSIITELYVVNNLGGTLVLDNIDVDNEICGNTLGEIEILVSGGTTPYTYSWSNGETTQNIFNLSAGAYQGTVIDNSGCETTTGELNIINEPGSLQLDNVSTLHEICSNNQGSVNITVSGGILPYQYNWNNGSTSEDLLNILAGAYNCTVTDVNGCLITTSAVVNNDQGTLSIDNMIVTNEVCANGQGAINLVASGGAPTITYLWSNGESTEDISNLSEGVFTCTVTDNNGCSVNNNATINNNVGSLSIDNVAITNEICSNTGGSINITISGGYTPLVYNWSNSATSEDLSNVSAGTYTCTITDNSGCSLVAGPYDVNNTGGALIIDDITVTNEICGNGTGVIDLTVSGSGTVSYSWSNSATTEDLSGLYEGNYDVTISDGNGCNRYESVTVLNEAGTLSLDNHNVTDEICGNGLGNIDIAISGGTTPYAFNWSGGQSTKDITNLNAGQYSVTITDNNSCEIVSAIYALNDNPGNFSLLSLDVSDEQCGDGTGEINVTVQGGQTPINYSWASGQATEDISALSAGVYSCTATDVNGCTLIFSTIVQNQPGNLSVDNAVITDEMFGNSNGGIDLMIVGGALPLSFQWSNGATTKDITNVAAGAYSCVITDNNGCAVNYTGEVTNTLCDLVITNTTIINETCGGQNGAIDVTTNGGVLPLTYMWSNGVASQDLMGISAGVYILTITDMNGCSLIETATVINSNNGFEVSDMIVTNDYCNNGSGQIDITISGGTLPYTFNWSNGATTEDLIGLSEGTFGCTITDNASCIISATTDVLNIFDIGFYVENANIIDEHCGNLSGSIDLTITGGTLPYSFIWSNNEITEDIIGLGSGTYTCTVSDNAGCSLVNDYEIVNSEISIYSEITNTECGADIGAIDITISNVVNPVSVFWSSGQTTEDIVGLSDGSYTVTIIDASGCVSVQTFSVGEDSPSDLGFSVINITDEICGHSDGIINAEPLLPGDYLYELNGIQYSGPFVMVADLSAGEYVLSIIEGYCSYDTTLYIENVTPFTAQINSISNEYCGQLYGAVDIEIVPSGAYSYIWSNGMTTQDISSLSTGIYNVTIDNGLGCQQILTAEVIDQSNINVSYIATDEFCGDGQGAIDLTVNGGVEPYLFMWIDGTTSEDITGVSAGVYSCIITDDVGCEFTIEVEISNDTGAISVSADITNTECGTNIGAIDITVSNAVDPVSVFWSSGQITEDVVGLSVGSYTVTITDASGCTSEETFSVEEEASSDLGFSFISITDEYCGNNNGLIYADPLQPGEYMYELNGIQYNIPFVMFTDLSAGEYVLSIIEGYCRFDTALYIENITSFTAQVNSVSNEYCGQSDGVVDIEIVPSGTYSYIWSNGMTTQDISDLSAGIYNVTITDEQGCQQILTAEVINQSDIEVSYIATDETCGNAQGAIDLTVNGGVEPYSFIWDEGSTLEDITGLSAGVYSCIITDNLGCELTIDVEIINSIGSISVLAGITNTECGGDIGAIDITISDVVYPVSVSWSTGQITEDIGGLSVGSYTVTIIDDLGCTLEETFSVEEDTPSDLGFSIININHEYCGSSNGSISAEPLQYGDYLYELNGIQYDIPFVIFEDLSAGEYVLSIIEGACRFDTTLYIENIAPFTAQINSITNEYCGQSDGTVDVEISPLGSYSYIWSNGMTTQDISNLSTGIYNVIITDEQGCMEVLTAEVINQSNLVVSYIVTDETCGDGQGAIDLTVNGGVEPYSFTWINGTTSEDIADLSAGVYSCVITDDVGCEVIVEVEISNNTGAMSVSVDITDDMCNEGSGMIDLTITGITNASVVWSNGATTEDLTGLNLGTYSVTVIDIDNSCEYYNEYEVGNAGLFNSSGSVTDASCFDCNDGAIDITVDETPLLSIYTYSWSTDATTEDIDNLLPGDYAVIITDNQDCSDVLTFTVDYFLGDYTVSNKDFLIKVYPNPTNGKVIIEAEDIQFIDVINVDGRKIYSTNQSKQIDLSKHSKGIYFIKVTTEKGVGVEKIILK